jgi:LCP family protein required for cell wall assembly
MGRSEQAALRKSMGPRGRSVGHYKSKPNHRWLRRTFIGVSSLAVVVVLVVAAGWFYLQYELDHIARIAIPGGVIRPAAAGQPFNVLLVGSDSRAGVSGSQSGSLGSSSQVAGQRSDVIVVVHVVPATHQVTMLSIPRDLFVHIPGDTPGISGENKINAAFNNGPSLLIQTIETDLGIPINHFAEVGFESFQTMVNDVGGVYLDFPMPVIDEKSGLKVTATGCQLVGGTEALALVRSRYLYYFQHGAWHQDVQSDFSRIRRQDAFFRALLDRVRGSIANPVAMIGFVNSTSDSVTIDSSWTAGDLISLADDMHAASSSSLVTETLPVTESVSSSGADILLEAQPYDHAMIARLLAEGTSPAAAPASSTAATTPVTTTVPPDVVTNTTPEPWNPTPCTP